METIIHKSVNTLEKKVIRKIIDDLELLISLVLRRGYFSVYFFCDLIKSRDIKIPSISGGLLFRQDL